MTATTRSFSRLHLVDEEPLWIEDQRGGPNGRSRPGSLQGGRSGFGQLSSSTVLGRASNLGRKRTYPHQRPAALLSKE